jgi:hypothetical protein
MSDYLSPLRRAERFLAVRLVALERMLPPDGADHPRWPEYLAVVTALVAVRAQLLRPAPVSEAPALRSAKPDASGRLRTDPRARG